MDADLSVQLCERVRAAAADGTPLAVTGGGTKAFLGRVTQAERFDVAGHRGIVSYEPTELVLSARGGTLLAEVEAALAERGQMLAFEPPAFGETATIGGTVAAGLSGPARPYAGAARDFMLGTQVLNGKGEVLRFGGEVMKNVAGYDVSRLMTGACGTLGVLLEVSLKVLPRPTAERTVIFDTSAAEAIAQCNAWAAKPLPLTGACHDGERLFVRLAGTRSGVDAAAREIGGDSVSDTPDQDPVAGSNRWWAALREQTLPFFTREGPPLWRLSVPPGAAPLNIAGDIAGDITGDTLVDWGGALRWLRTAAPAVEVRAAAERAGGHAMLFRGGDRTGEVFHPLAPVVRTLHERLKTAFDPAGIFNPGRMYEGI
ncbi:MAG: glycolate oxidase subunit GlcE [Thiotrichales bacterium]|nr:glycolate oxidase subunit GlcE [Thiotrichales bacterium]